MHDWQQLTDLTQNKEITIERIKVVESGISIKDMEELYGVSYPSIKNRLNRISKTFDFIDLTPANQACVILEDLDKGNISFDQAMEALKK